MRGLGILSSVGLLTVFAGPAIAQDIWSLNITGASCRVSFTSDPVLPGISATMRHDHCPYAFEYLSGYSMNNGDGTVVFYSTAPETAQIGRVDKERDGYYVGMTSDGLPLELVYVGPQQQPATTTNVNCIQYHNGGCANGNDIGPPPFSNGESYIYTVANLNVRFTPGLTSTITGTVAAGYCVKISRCQTHFDGTLWCELMTTNVRGWVLKQDSSFVYSRNLCG